MIQQIEREDDLRDQTMIMDGGEMTEGGTETESLQFYFSVARSSSQISDSSFPAV